MESDADKFDLVFESAGDTAAARDVTVQAFGGVGAFLENGEEGPFVLHRNYSDVPRAIG